MTTPSNTLEEAIGIRYNESIKFTNPGFPSIKNGVLQSEDINKVKDTRVFFTVQTSTNIKTNSASIYESNVVFNIYDRNWNDAKNVTDELEDVFDVQAFKQFNINVIDSRQEDNTNELIDNTRLWQFTISYVLKWQG